MKKICAAVCLPLLVAQVACIRDEGANIEADIVSCTFRQENVLKVEPMIGNNTVTALVLGNADLTSLTPVFTLSEGATIVPGSGVAQDFTSPRLYTVTSEDGQWTKNYTVAAIDREIPTVYRFDSWAPEGKYEIPYEPLALSAQEVLRMMIWSSGNAAFSLTGMADRPGAFPTARTAAGRGGSPAPVLVTRSTGAFGALAGMRLAAGNLFIGTFDAEKAMSNALAATRFGIPFGRKPDRLKGYYTYTSGATYQDANGNAVAGRTDSCSIYAVFYERDAALTSLDGSNALTHTNIVAVADLTERRQTNEFLAFDIPFVYRREVDPAKLAAYRYSLAVVLSSSEDGGRFSGAVGSTLVVDDLEVVCESSTSP